MDDSAKREARREAQRRYREAHREILRDRDREYRETNHEADLDRKRRYRETNHDADLESKRRYHAAVRAKVLTHYSPYAPPRCACCGAADRLTIDHVNGDGAEHRKELFGDPNRAYAGFYLWLIKQNFPSGYQVLCNPCNASKKKGAHCQLHQPPRG